MATKISQMSVGKLTGCSQILNTVKLTLVVDDYWLMEVK